MPVASRTVLDCVLPCEHLQSAPLFLGGFFGRCRFFCGRFGRLRGGPDSCGEDEASAYDDLQAGERETSFEVLVANEGDNDQLDSDDGKLRVAG